MFRSSHWSHKAFLELDQDPKKIPKPHVVDAALESCWTWSSSPCFPGSVFAEVTALWHWAFWVCIVLSAPLGLARPASQSLCSLSQRRGQIQLRFWLLRHAWCCVLHGGTESPVVSLVTCQMPVPYFWGDLQNGDILILSFPLHWLSTVLPGRVTSLRCSGAARRSSAGFPLDLPFVRYLGGAPLKLGEGCWIR